MDIRFLTELALGPMKQVEFCHPMQRDFQTRWARSKDAPRFVGVVVARHIADGLAIICRSDDRPTLVEITDAGRKALESALNAWEAA